MADPSSAHRREVPACCQGVQVYRLSAIGPRLPQHWAYYRAWELLRPGGRRKEPAWRDNRFPGFQVWPDLPAMIAATFAYHDGNFRPEDGYRHLLVIQAAETSSGTSCGVGEWHVVAPEHVSAVFCGETAALHAWLAERGVPGRAGAVRRWVEAREEEVLAWLVEHAPQVPTEFVETLPCPGKYTLVRKSGERVVIELPYRPELDVDDDEEEEWLDDGRVPRRRRARF